VIIEERARVVVVKNGADRSYWLAPAAIELWEGGAPWVETDPGGGRRELRPGDAIERNIGERADTVRVGVRLWPDAVAIELEEPWFTWLEVAGAG
jgi:hypothetical protein